MRTRIIGALLGVALLGACSAQQVPPQDVASVGPTSERPRFRIDMTNDEEKALYDPYRKCVADHGVSLLDRTATKNRPDVAKANKECESLLPLPAWENDASNPEALDFNRRVVTCLRAKGVKYVEVSKNDETGLVGPSYGGPQNDQESITKGMDLTPKCQQEVVAGGYK